MSYSPRRKRKPTLRAGIHRIRRKPHQPIRHITHITRRRDPRRNAPIRRVRDAARVVLAQGGADGLGAEVVRDPGSEGPVATGGALHALLDHAVDFGAAAGGGGGAQDSGFAVEELHLQEADGFAVVAGFADLALGFLHYLREDDASVFRGGGLGFFFFFFGMEGGGRDVRVDSGFGGDGLGFFEDAVDCFGGVSLADSCGVDAF